MCGRKSLLKNNKKFNKKESNVYTRGLISPDAPWLDKNKYSCPLCRSDIKEYNVN